ncbi:MAG: hypothetical protein KIT58_07620 [Planctomycetota bacterium]|nr:hypothetical protein [Planctomycetota bacterium]
MNPKDFTDPAGELVEAGRGASAYRAFVPAPLPPRVEWAGLVTPLAAATLSLGQLGGTGHTLPNPHLLLRPFLDHRDGR